MCLARKTDNFFDTILYERQSMDTVIFLRFDSLNLLIEQSKARLEDLFYKVRKNGWKYHYISVNIIYNERYNNTYIPLIAAKQIQDYIEEIYSTAKYETIYIRIGSPSSISHIEYLIAEIRLHSPP